MTHSKKQQQEQQRKKKQQDARHKNPHSKTTYSEDEAGRSDKKQKKEKNGFRNFSQKGANDPHKKANGHSAISPTTKKLAEAAKRRSRAGQESKRNYTRKYTQSSPALVVLWSRKRQPEKQQQEMPFLLRAECGNSEG